VRFPCGEHKGEIFRTGTLTALGFSIAGFSSRRWRPPLFGYTGSIAMLIAVAAVDLLILPPLRFSESFCQVEMRLWYSVVIGWCAQAMWWWRCYCWHANAQPFTK
jgi:hypothetical protein